MNSPPNYMETANKYKLGTCENKTRTNFVPDTL